MRFLLVLSLVLTVVSPLCATVILTEDFEGGVVGNALNAVNGWTSTSNFVFADTAQDGKELDQGQCASWTSHTSPSWPVATRNFTHSPVAGEQYSFAATMYGPGDGSGTTGLTLNDTGAGAGKGIGAAMGNGLYFGSLSELGTSNSVKVTVDGTKAYDVKLDFSGTAVAYAYREHNATAWISAGSQAYLDVPGGSWATLGGFNQVEMYGMTSYVGAVDSISLTSSVIPEPSVVVLLFTGLIGLLAYAWRKQK